MASGIKASIVILTYNNLEFTRQCLESVYTKTTSPPFEVILVDNASRDGTPQFLQKIAQTHPNVRLVLNEANEGFARGNNLGAAQASGDYLVFLNNDTVVTRGWLEGLIAHLADPDVGMVGPVTNSSANETCIQVGYSDLVNMDGFAESYTRDHEGRTFDISMLAFLCVGMRKAVYEEIGPLDEQFGTGMFEDDDYALRVKQKGYRIICAEDVFIHHWGSVSFSRLGMTNYMSLFKENLHKFERKWGTRWYPPLQRPDLIPSRMRQLIDGAIVLSEALQQKEAELDKVYGSFPLRLVRPLRRFVAAPAPQGNFIKKGAWAFFRAIHVTLREGPRGLFRKISARIGGYQVKQFVKRIIKPFVPERTRKFFREFREELPYYDRSEVILYADASILPWYPSRQSSRQPDSQTRQTAKVSLIATTYNEAANVKGWLESVKNQTRQPDEILIVDGGSTDGTPDIIRDQSRSLNIDVRLIASPGANIARGRNIAIQNAHYPIIACSDFGCVLDKDWLRWLILPFEQDETVSVSMGFYQPNPADGKANLYAPLFINRLDTINPQTFPPSSRSLAIKKQLWAMAGGYPEWLTDAGEDTLFDFRMKGIPSRWAFVPQAIVYWHIPGTLKNVHRAYYRYAKGDGEAGTFASLYWAELKQLIKAAFLAGFLVLAGTALLGLAIFTSPWVFLGLVLMLSAALYLGYRFIHTRAKMLSVSFYEAVFYLFAAAARRLANLRGFSAGVRNRSRVRKRQEEHFASQLTDILSRHSDVRGVVVYLPTHDWGYMFQRPHQMARVFARKGYLFFYCTNNEKTDWVVGFQEVEPRLYLSHVPLETFRSLPNPLVYIGAAWHRKMLPLFDQPRVIYDHYDDLEVSAADPEDHFYLLETADVVLVTSLRLARTIREKRPDAILLPNAVDYEFIQQNRPRQESLLPQDWETVLRKGCKVAGYSGALAQWFDYELLGFLARERPDLEFVLVGVSYDGSLERSGILNLENVHWLGMKPYQDLFTYVWRFDIALIPFIVNDVTLSTSPIKLYEYMACRKPIVTSALPEAKRYEGVFVAEDHQGFAALLEEALQKTGDDKFLDMLDRFARENTWEKRLEALLDRLNEDKARPGEDFHDQVL